MQQELEIRFSVSDVEHTVSIKDVSPETTLNSYLRDKLHLTATKKMCLEGGCGACIVAVQEVDSKGNNKIFAVNSCLVSIYSCHGWKILSNEGIGNPIEGYNKIQKLLASNNGTQCGFCSSGMVMNMYALSESGGKTREEIENSFGGNLCRCTGYRPILTAFKQLATDSDDIMNIDDLEDFESCNPIKCQTDCPKPCKKVPIYFDLKDTQWLKVYKLVDLLNVLRTVRNKRYMLVAGNTARGVYWLTEATTPEVYIDVTGVLELTTFMAQKDSLILGGNMSLTNTMEIFRNTSKKNSKFVYLDGLARHIDLVAHVPVRNIGTLAGNLMIKHQHNEFPSDIFLILETVKATLVIVDSIGNESLKSPADFLKISMDKKVIKQIIFPPYGDAYYYTSYKVMPRSQNAHAMVNAGFLFQLTNSGIVQSAQIVYGAINPNFIHAKKTESLLKGKQLFDNTTLQSAFKSLDSELQPDWILPDPTPAFRKQLAINLFYKGVLRIAPSSKLTNRNKSGGTLLTRPVSNGTQQIYPKQQLYPLTQPIPKLEALAQTSGQAQYILDLPELPGQLHGCLVKAGAMAGSTIVTIDATAALQRPDVMAFFTAKDIPGINNLRVRNISLFTVDEKLFCEDTVEYFYQPVGIIIANTHDAAIAAAALVKVKTTPPVKKPFLTIRDVLKAGATDRIKLQSKNGSNQKGSDVQKTIKGQCYINSQYHFHMETQSCVVIPTEDGLNVFAGTQWMDATQGAIAQTLNIPSQQINIFVRRLGGAFGAKISRNLFVTSSVALAAYKLRKPVSMWMSFNDNMDIIGKRYYLYADYEVDVNSVGLIQYLKVDLYSDFGIGGNDPIDHLLVHQFPNGYIKDYFTFNTYTVKTDNCAHCYTRAPGSFEGLATIENIMDHIAYSLNKDPLAVRRANLNTSEYPQLKDILDDVEKNDEITKRKADIATYNKANRWKKRGLSVVPMQFKLDFRGNFTTLVSIYHLDGGVAISHAGIEMGQGINTKVAQACAYKLGIPLEKISIKPNYNVASPNSGITGGSITSESVVGSVLSACDILLDRIKPIRDKNPTLSWEDLIQECYNQNICLSSSGFFWPQFPGIGSYSVYGACALEVEIDILTGKHEILRVDIVEDVGQSMSPLIDIGQLEGAFIMGLGAHSSEELILDASGKLTNDRTWTYKIPGAKDIPQIFNVRFVNNSLNPLGTLNSKAIAEPPCGLSVAFPLAVRNALASARQEASQTAFPWYPIDGPSSTENILMNAFNNYSQYTL
ncbi:xanthine dehydrogenase/oxidase-like [Euwallacea similis]|uniref:xanthine dehydrogenase/oxidase-like n=1 Tax=Euwallacea similis TaxID=1736056 RepID=UPI00344C50D2